MTTAQRRGAVACSLPSAKGKGAIMASRNDKKREVATVASVEAQNVEAPKQETAQAVDITAFINAMFSNVGQTAQAIGVTATQAVEADSLYRASATLLRCSEVRKSTRLTASMVYGACFTKPLTESESSEMWKTIEEKLARCSNTRKRKLDYLFDTVQFGSLKATWKQRLELIDTWILNLERFKKQFETSQGFEAAQNQVIEKASSLIFEAAQSKFGSQFAELFKGGAISDKTARDIAIAVAEYKASDVHENTNVRAKYYSSHLYKWKDLKFSEIIDASLKVCGQLKESEYVPSDTFKVWNNAVKALTTAKTSKQATSIDSSAIDNDLI